MASPSFNPAIFREYDIRGVADRDLNSDLVFELGRAFATLVAKSGNQPTVAVGRDCRVTSDRLRAALLGGLSSAGCKLIDIGVVPTPVLYFAPFHLQVAGAIIITGSHNPPQDNGFKLLVGRETIHSETIRHLRELVMAGLASGTTPRLPVDEKNVEKQDVSEAYMAHATSQLRLGSRRFKVVLDAGSGAGGPIGLELYRRLGFDVTPLYCEMDGRFPYHHPDPTQPENLRELQKAVIESGADVGIAFDGDADRIGAVDSQGRILWGDQLMQLFGKAILKENPGAAFVAEVKCSQALFDELEKAGGKPIMWKVGHSLIKSKLKEMGGLLGGEMSGHMFFAHRYLGFDDAIYAGARLLEILTQSERSLAQLYDDLPVMVNTPEIRVDCPDESKFNVVKQVTESLRKRSDVVRVVDIDGVRVHFADGWGLVRASNTQPALVLRCEASTPARLAEIRSIVESAISAAKG